MGNSFLGLEDSIDTNRVVKLLKIETNHRGYEFKILRMNVRRAYEEKTLCVGGDDAVVVVFFIDIGLVKIIKSRNPGVKKVLGFKQVLMLGNDNVRERVKVEKDEWVVERIGKDDVEGLNWLLKMHSEGRVMSRGSVTSTSSGELEWAKIKFETVNSKGKLDVLKYLAFKTGCELEMVTRRRRKIIVIGKRSDCRFVYQLEDNVVEVHNRGSAVVGAEKRSPHVVQDPAFGSNKKAVIGEDTELDKAVHGATVEGLVVMDGSMECSRLRKICRTVKGDLYPPREVANMF